MFKWRFKVFAESLLLDIDLLSVMLMENDDDGQFIPDFIQSLKVVRARIQI